MTAIEILGQNAKTASRRLSIAGAAVKNNALVAISAALRDGSARIVEANAADLAAAREGGMRPSLLDRLELNLSRIESMADSVLEVAALDDPVGKYLNITTRPNGLQIGKKTVPLGVIAMIYEARPNVTVDAASLCLKSGNTIILRGGKEAFNTNAVLTEIMREALAQSGLPADCVALVQDTSRDSVDELMNLTGVIDLLVPRGGAGLINHVCANAKVPVVQTGVGNCHVYVEKTADLEMAANIIFNAKCSRPSVCNAAETLLVDRAVAATFLPMAKTLLDERDTVIKGCPETGEIISAQPATDDDWAAEYGDYTLAVRVVDGFDAAVEHIARWGSGHSEAIVTNDYTLAHRFTDEVDAAAVYVNASTRFTDGGEFGLGAEIGISTQKMHARGPMGVEQLTSVKYVVLGNGQIRN